MSRAIYVNYARLKKKAAALEAVLDDARKHMEQLWDCTCIHGNPVKCDRCLFLDRMARGGKDG